MTKKSKISVLLTALGVVGLGVTAFVATKNIKSYEEAVNDAEYEKDKTLTDEEFEKLMEEQGVTDPSEVEYLSKKERAVIFAKTFWPTFVAGTITSGCNIAAQVLDIKEILELSGVCAALAYKYDDAMNYIRTNFPDQYKDFQKFIDTNAAKRHFEEKPLKKEETFDGRDRYYEPDTEQDIFMTPQNMIDLQHWIDAVMATEMGITLNDILYHIKENYDKHVRVPVKNYNSWSLPDDRCPETYDFIRINTSEITDVKDKDGEPYVARILRFESYDDTDYDELDRIQNSLLND